MFKYALTIVYIVLTTSGIYFMKLGGDTLSLSLKDSLTFKVGFITMIGLLCYLVSFLLWQKLVVSYDLTYMVPIVTGIVQIIILLLGIFAFKEKLSGLGLFGILLIITGIVLLAFSKK